MRHVVGFFIVVFLMVFGALYWKNHQKAVLLQVPTLRVYATSSFISQWGPGPWLRDEFEKQFNCRVEFQDSVDTPTLVQRLKTDPKHQAADVVMGVDQLDAEILTSHFEWTPISVDLNLFEPSVQGWLSRSPLVPYNFSFISFVGRRSQLSPLPQNLQSLLEPRFRGQLSLPDPRTSSVGLQFLAWVVGVMGEDEAFNYIKKLQPQVKVFGTGWSMSYGLFQKGQVLSTLSYITSPVYHLIEDKDNDVVALEFQEGHPLQIELMGLVKNCTQCDLGEKWIHFVLSEGGQKRIMEKNFMFPVRVGVKNASPFGQVPLPRLKSLEVPSSNQKEAWLRRWSQIRKS